MRALWWRVAWRNLWRNRGRTAITATGLAFGYLAAVVMVGLTDGMRLELIENGTGLLVGQVQVHADTYLPERSMHRTIGGYEGGAIGALLTGVTARPDVAAVTPRVYGGGLVSSGDQTVAAFLMGVDPDAEPRVSSLLSRVDEGRAPAPGAHELLLGVEIANRLGLAVGDEVVLVAPAADGSMGNDLFTLVGTLATGTTSIDATHAVLALTDLQGLLALDPGRIHELSVVVTRPEETGDVARSLEAALVANGWAVRARPWTELRPELAESVALMDSVNFIIVLVIFGMAVFGVANTMLIGTYERRKEFAVVRALGTTPSGVGRTVIYEGVILGSISLVVGALLTAPVMVWWHVAPPDLSGLFGGFEWSGALWRPSLRVEYSVDAPVLSAVALFVTTIVAAVYPVWRVVRIPPADALGDR